MSIAKMRIRLIKEVEVEGLGDIIKQARLDSRKSVEQICSEIGVSRTYWYDIEKETLRGTLSFENFQKIQQVLNLDLKISFDD